MENNKVCCDFFKDHVILYDWYSFGESPNKTFLMPTIKNTNIRVNFCPTCGGEVRSVEIKEREFKNYQ